MMIDRFPDLNGMGTTIVLTIVFDTTALIAHLGDSRAYSYADGKFTQLVEDHSLVNELVKMDQITKEQAKHHPQKNIITQALGVSSTIDPRLFKLHGSICHNSSTLVFPSLNGLHH